MFTLIGRFYSSRLTNPIGFLRRMAQNNPKDYGKFMVLNTASAFVAFWIMNNRERLTEMMVQHVGGVKLNDEMAEELSKPDLRVGDRIIFNDKGHNIEGVIKKIYATGDLIVDDSIGDVFVSPDSILETFPQY